MRARIPAAAGAILLSACTLLLDTDKLEPPGPSRAEVEAFAGAYYDAYLSAYARVWSSTAAHARIRTGLYDRATFIARAWSVASRGNRRHDPAMKAQCLAELASAPDAAAVALLARDPASSCRRAAYGILETGASCAWDTECSGDSYCSNPLYSCPGTCMPKLGAGSTCTLAEQYVECAAGFSCIMPGPGAATGSCVENFQDAGQPCGGTTPRMCRPGYRCVSESCTAALAAFAPGCAWNADCQPGLYCDVVDTLCKPTRQLTESCVQGGCQLGARCDEFTTCVELPVDGASCGMLDAGEYAGCLVGLCDGTTSRCSRVRGYLDSCSAGDICEYSGWCDPGRGVCSGHCP